MGMRLVLLSVVLKEHVMKAFKALTSLLLIVATIGCNKTDKRIEVTERLARGQSVYMGITDNSHENLNVNSSGQWGNIVGGYDMDTNFFNNQVRGLMTATMPESRIGTVSSVAGPSSGVKFQGGVRATFAGNVVSNVDLPSAQLRIAIWDSFAGSEVGGKIITEYAIHLFGAEGIAQGNTIDLSFSDAYGSIRLAGTITGGIIQGTVTFQNKTNPYMSTLPQGGKLGNFTIAVCDFFNCI